MLYEELKNMRKNNFIIWIAFLAVVLSACEEDLTERDEYKRPSWLAGKVYTQVKDNPDLSIFARCIELSGYDSVIDVSGSYTVFAPHNKAFEAYLSSKPGYSSVENIPLKDLLELVKYHIVQNPWSLQQLRSLDINGWIDTLDIVNNKPRGFKRETLLQNQDRFFGISYEEDNGFVIVDTTIALNKRKVITDSRKYAPVFYKEFFDIYELGYSNFDFYFNREFKPDKLYYAGAEITTGDIFAENGFVHIIDRVVEPLRNVNEILEDKEQDNDYSDFLGLINLFPEFIYNETQTMDQPGADEGFVVDSLFDLKFPGLTFNIVNEKISFIENIDYITIRYHQGVVAPTNEALNSFSQQYLVGQNRWGSISDAPRNIKQIIVNTHLSEIPLFPSYLSIGYPNGEADLVKLDESSITHREFASNATFLGVDKAIVPRAFVSVTGPVYLEKRFSRSMYAIEASGLLSALKREGSDYIFLVEPDDECQQDSSLFYNEREESFFLYIKGTQKKEQLTISDLRTLLLNHIGTSSPKGVARKEFVKTLSGNYMVFNNETGEVRGTGPTTDGYKGVAKSEVVPQHLYTADNGKTYSIQDWLSFNPRKMFIQISELYPAFHQLIEKAGLSIKQLSQYKFISESDNYTVFIPNSAALAKYNTDTLTQKELERFIMSHFVQGSLIFTDGSSPKGFYETTRVDEKSTDLRKVFTSIHIEGKTDQINFINKQGGIYYSIVESEKTNILCGRLISDPQEVYPASVVNAVIHEIDTVLRVDFLEIK
jgi:uncharacterized surface protein with fasciclin (FAS1) repeats